MALVAPSGAGKSTLLHIAGLLEQPDGGEVFINDAPTSRLDDAARTALRRTDIGFVYQFHHLLPEFSALENVVLPQMIARPAQARGRRARRANLLGYLGLEERVEHRPARALRRRAAARRDRPRARQRAAHAAGRRADRQPRSAAPRSGCFRALTQLVRASGLAALIATHNMDLAARMDRRVTLRDGKLVEVE